MKNNKILYYAILVIVFLVIWLIGALLVSIFFDKPSTMTMCVMVVVVLSIFSLCKKQIEKYFKSKNK